MPKIEKANQSRLLILDEIHKSKNWKQKLKSFYDTLGSEIDIIVTGSARLNVFKKGGDSMMGRYLNFRMHPLSYEEVSGHEALEPDLWLTRLLKKPTATNNEEKLNQLLALSGFPERFF